MQSHTANVHLYLCAERGMVSAEFAEAVAAMLDTSAQVGVVSM